MPEIFLPSGAQVLCSAEDYDLCADVLWRTWELKGVPRAVREVTSKGRRYRLHLHREVAFRMRPDLLRSPGRMSVAPANGSFLDVRRENLEITVRPCKRGASRRPAGWKAAPYAATGRGTKPAPAWARGAAPEPPVFGD